MSSNLNDWLGDHLWAWWLAAVALVLGAAVVFRSRFALGIAGGAAAAVAVALFLPGRFWTQAGAAVMVGSVGAVLAVRARREPGTHRAAG